MSGSNFVPSMGRTGKLLFLHLSILGHWPEMMMELIDHLSYTIVTNVFGVSVFAVAKIPI